MAQRDIDNIDKTILDNFYKLVHTQPHVRLTAASSTYKILDALKKKEPTKFNDNLNYCIDRLVAGLASSRALARQGYGTLLLELLKSYQVSTERLFSVANDKFGQISRETSRDNLIGYFLLVSIVLKSENHTKSKANSKYVEKMYKIVMQLLNKKSYMECPISRLLMDYYQLFCDYMIADIPPEMIRSSNTEPSRAEILTMVITEHRESTLNISRFLKSSNHDAKDDFAKRFVNILDKSLLEEKSFITWDEYFMAVAQLAARRSKDPSTQVGACIVNEQNKIVATGYNGMPNGIHDNLVPWSKEGSYLDTKYAYVVHAELNAILNSILTDQRGCRVYVSLFPCNECAKAIIQSGIKHVIYLSDKHADKDTTKAAKIMFKMAGVSFEPYM